jgi:hypothetical protein
MNIEAAHPVSISPMYVLADAKSLSNSVSCAFQGLAQLLAFTCPNPKRYKCNGLDSRLDGPQFQLKRWTQTYQPPR